MNSDRDFIEAFESCSLPPEQFHHRDHIRLAWLYLREQPLLEALPRFVASLRRYAESLGKPGLYHATITWAYLLLINERMQHGHADDFDSFAAANPELFGWEPSILASYYQDGTLASDLARATFVFPDRAAQSNSVTV